MSAAAQMDTASPQLAAELWISFASLLRSHVAMHAVAHPNAGLRMDGHSAGLELLGANGRLTISEPGVSGAGVVEFSSRAAKPENEHSAFFFTPDGFIRFEDLNREFDMEAAVEHLLRKVQA